MKANELRIGNLVSFIDTGEIGKITEVSEKFLEVYFGDLDEHTHIELYTFQPIPLTEEWLVKLGFERGGYDLIEVHHPDNARFVLYGYLGDDDNSLGWNYDTEIEIKGTTFRDSLVEIKHVHQLQNLYFALTNKELSYEK